MQPDSCKHISFSIYRISYMAIFCALLGVSSVNAHDTTTVYADIEWDEERPLTWDDYQLKVFSSHKGQLAITSVKHSIRGELKNGLPDFEVKVRFIAGDSWTTDHSDAALLAHEQLHFDIGELFRRRIKQRVDRLRDSGEKQKAIYRYVIRKELDEFRTYSKKYDRVTRHGALKDEQEKWQTKVWDELKRLH